VELSEHEPSVSRSAAEAIGDQLTVARQLLSHAQQGGSLHKFALLLKPTWRRFLDAARVQGRAPLSVEEFHAIITHLELERSRDKLARSWRKVGESIGLPAIDTIAHPREQKLEVYATQIRRALTWWESEFHRLSESLDTIGFQWSAFRAHHVGRLAPATPFDHDMVIARKLLPVVVEERLSRIRRLRSQRQLVELRDALVRFTGPVVEAVRDAVDRADPIRYKLALASLNDLIVRSETVSRRRTLLERLGAVAPAWAAAIRDRIGVQGATFLPGEPTDAWRWVQCDQELRRRAALDEVSLMAKLHELQQELRRTTVKLIDRKAWSGQMQRVTLQAQQALQGWAQLQRKIGRGTGKRVPELQAAARRLLAEARDAVPVWIMPLTRVAENIDLSRDRFDVVIVDEASQSDVLGLLAWYLGHSIVVVGDDQQVSPLAVGQSIDAVTALRLQYLTSLPNNETYDAQTSVYDLAGQCFGGTIALREHFRCVPEIIAFSNHLSYEGSIRPLRDPSRVPRPHVVEVVADESLGGFRRGSAKVNHSEARLITALLKACLEHPRYAGATFGAITLLGDEQAKLLQDLALELVGAVALDRCRFAAGNSAQFQGDERNVIFLSMVDGPRGEVHRMSNLPATRQRYNVAASRAQDQLWLVHSLNPVRDLHAGDLRRRLIEHVRDPNAMQREFEKREALTESPFEKAVLRDLLAVGYDVEPQVWVGRYRLDFVIRSGGRQVAFECDGDRYHGFEKIGDDLARQAVLERAGWRFVRVRGSQYFRDPKWTMKQACERLAQLGIEPSSSEREGTGNIGSDPVTTTLLQRAWEIMRERAWVVTATGTAEQMGVEASH
jgi:very-short-patch-repair endonuclease